MRDEKKIEQLIQRAVNAAVEAGIDTLEQRIQAAINIGVEIGAAAAAEAAAAATARAAARERRRLQRQQQDRRYHDTKLLIRKYRQLNAYYQSAVFDEEAAVEVDEDFEEIMRSFGHHRDEKLTAESIRRGYLVSRIIMAHVNTMLEVYQTMCQHTHRAEEKRRWRVLYAMYLADEPFTAAQVAEQEGIDKRTVYKDIDACLPDLAILFFGTSGLDRE
ncbi:MAG: hypothetical protein K2O18_16405 [Oscillospiraceae bacterium]|nr:hypothetical protein [Oscillospiraceae bacterium]